MKNKAIKSRYDFMIIFDAENVNRYDEAVDNKRIVGEIRKYVECVKKDIPGYEVYTEDTHREKMEKAYRSFALKSKREKRQQITPERQLQKWMCKRYFDVRAFGADMIVGENPGGMLKGPIHLGNIKSVDTDSDNPTCNPTYALYKVESSISVILAEKTGFSDDDLELFLNALENIFKNNNGVSSNQKITIRKLIVFKHKNSLGNAAPQKVFESVKITRKDNISSAAKGYSDYDIKIDYGNLPVNVEIRERV